MINLKKPNENRVVKIKVSGKVSRDDYRQRLPELEEILNDGGTFRFFIEMEEVTGFEAGALWEDLKFDLKHKDQNGKVALVGDRKWEERVLKLADLFFKAEMKYFPRNCVDEAWEWVNS